MTTDPGLGVLETGSVASQQAGSSVAAVLMNSDGSNDFLVGTPNGSGAWLIFTNSSVSPPTTKSWLSLTPEQRVGIINNLGTTGQTNPFTDRAATQYAFNFNGVSFTDNQASSQLGSFVAAAGDNAFVIGAPGYTNGGRLYYVQAVTGTPGFSLYAGQTINLDNPGAYSDLTIVTFEDTAQGAGNTYTGLGTSFAELPNLFGGNPTGVTNLVIGEPGASITPTGSTTRTDNGGVFVLPSTLIPGTGGGTNIVQVSAQTQFTFAGAHSFDGAGYAVANAGDVNGVVDSSGNDVSDLLIGDPHYLQPQGAANGTGAAFLVYGGISLTNGATANLVDLSQLSVRPTSTTGQAPAQGAVFIGAGSDAAGFSVSSAGGFNPAVDSFGDFMIGSPGGNGQAGRVNLFYGAATGTYTQFGTSGGFSAGLLSTITNPIALNNPTAPLALTGVSPVSASFVGAGSNFHAGTSISYVSGTTSAASIILIGAPNDTTSSGSGSVYELLGPSTGTFTTQLQPLTNAIARQYTLTYPTTYSSRNPIGFGTSVSALADGNGDFIAGAPGYTGTLPTTNNGTTTPILAVGAAAMVLSSLQPANTLIPLGGSPTPTPTPTPPIGVGAVAGAVLPGTFVPTTYIPPLGTSFVPTVTALSALNYAPIPLKVALQQYLPPDGFIQRIYEYNHPGKPLPPNLQQRGQNHSKHTYGSSGVWTLGSKVFTRGRIHPGKTYQWTHTSPHNGTQERVVPAQLSREKYTSEGNPLGKV
ncbi:MAG TPA: hypothetical protein VKF17_11570 [Isosphaeraceae bacterium]|nr:hypothetical protein [Isosphaeraceae bacterium]